MNKELFALLVAGSLLVPHTSPALSNESESSQAWERTLRASLDRTQVPWVNWESKSTAPKADVMIGPKIDTLGPFLLPPATPATQFSSIWRFEPEFRTE